MSDYGLRVLNGSNEVQIDSTYRNFSLRSKGAAVANLNANHVNFRFAQIVIPNGLGMIAFRCAIPCCVASIYPSGGNLVVNFKVYTPNQAIHTVYWYLFDDPNYTAISGNYGMRIKDAGGNVTHDSRMDYMKFSGFVNGVNGPNGPILPYPNFSYTTYPGTVPAVIQSTTISSQTEVPIGVGPGVQFMEFFIWQMYIQAGESIGSCMCNEDYGPYTEPTNLPSISRNNYTYTVVDVAQYA